MANEATTQNGYVSSPEFAGLLGRAVRNPDGLTKDEKRQVEAAIENFPEVRQIYEVGKAQQGQEVPPEIQAAMETYNQLGAMIQPSAESIAASGPNGRKLAIAKLTATRGFKNMAGELPSLIMARQAGLAPTNDVQSALKTITVMPRKDDGQSQDYEIVVNDKSVKVRKTQTEKTAENLVATAIQMAPEALLDLVEKPLNMLTEMVGWPLAEAQAILAAVNGQHLVVNGDNQVIWKSVPERRLSESISRIVDHKDGAKALALLSMAPQLQNSFIPTDTETLKSLLKEVDGLVTKVRDLEVERELLAIGVEAEKTKEDNGKISTETMGEQKSFLSTLFQKIADSLKSKKKI
jgi:hypothetical protein